MIRRAGSGWLGKPERGDSGDGEERRSAAVSASEARSDAWRSSRPVISGGPSLLGLNVPADVGLGTWWRHDSLRPSSNVDYLLEDEEEPRRSRGKMILVVAALALAAGFGYMHWKQGGFDWLSGGDKKPAVATTQASDAAPSGDSGATTGGATPGQGRLRLREVWRVRRNLVRRRLVLRKFFASGAFAEQSH